MNISSQELKKVSKLESQTAARKAIEEAFSGDQSEASVLSDEIKNYLGAECQKEIKRFFEERNKEHEMSMSERRASINTSHAITGAITMWAVVGFAMLARSCINFDKGPKFKV